MQILKNAMKKKWVARKMFLFLMNFLIFPLTVFTEYKYFQQPLLSTPN